MKDIYSLAPVNKTAAVVVSQAGCTSHAGLSDEQKRKDLVARWKVLSNRMADLPPNSLERKRLGKDINALSLAINRLRPTKRNFDLGHYIIAIVKSKMTKVQWEFLVKEAEEKRAAAENCGNRPEHRPTAQGEKAAQA